MTNINNFNIVRYTPPAPGTTKEEQTQAQERKSPTQLTNYEAYKTDNTASATDKQSDTFKTTIYGSNTVKPFGGSETLNERKTSIDNYASRLRTQIGNIENGTEGERNVKFQNVRLFMEPAGYFSAGLLAAGTNPHEKFTVTFNSYVGKGVAENKSSSETRTYSAWEIAAGMLDHDKPARGGVLNFHSMVIKPKDSSKIKDLQSLGKQLQKHWEHDIATPMRGSAALNSVHDITKFAGFVDLFIPEAKISTKIPERSGKADAYVAKGAMQSLRNDKEAFEKLSPAGQEAVSRTLDKNGQVIIPNIYGYPLSGYAFIPYTPYDGDAKNRPNQGIMIDLKSGTAREIKNDDDFAKWAKNNRNELITRFNARDLQGGKDAHWPSAAYVLDSLIQDNRSHFPGRNTLLSDKSVPVRELFNYTESRGDDYQLKFGDLNKGIAKHYQDVNAKNAVWADQTQVFGSVERDWKAGKELWGNTFGYVPLLGNAGNIVFGQHDAEHGMTANDRVGGVAGAVISGLLLAHEVIPAGVEAGLGEPALNFNASNTGNYNWRYNAQSSELEFARAPTSTSNADVPSIAPKQPLQGTSTSKATTFPGMREIELNGKTYFVAETPDAKDGVHYVLRVPHPNDPTQLVNSGIIARPDDAGIWTRRGADPTVPATGEKPAIESPSALPPVNRLRPSQAGNISEHAIPNGDQLIGNTTPNAQGIYQIKDGTTGQDRWLIRYTDNTGSSKVYEIRSDFKLSNNYVQIINPTTRKPVLTVEGAGDGKWNAVSAEGGVKWPWQRPASPTPSDDLKAPATFAAEFRELDGKPMAGAEKLDEVLNVKEGTHYEFFTRNIAQPDGSIKKQLNVSWTVDETEFAPTPGEKAEPTEYSSSQYSSSFVKDIHRNPYSVTTTENGVSVTKVIDLRKLPGEEGKRLGLEMFEAAIPDADMRARISEVAHQGATVDAYADLLNGGKVKDGYFYGAENTEFKIDYNPSDNSAKVHVISTGVLTYPEKGEAPIPGVQVTIKRTFTIREGNELDSLYEIDKNAPSTVEVGATVDS
ncbi:hypothetical protein LVW35_04120 [Pseudomonas sp. HN11]|uniref:hypothetical protein n=1 Tax=Pseudomonas sp. HN11 TaxID=1344094 RepID=UPI001F41F02B|nr:hypothetical protein [Pseudomonas sp. HN11]UII72368.1 hypothetical protein LVW35_04120 [Pseudomonas sp. HN11]